MPAKRLPNSDEERVKAIQAIIAQEEQGDTENPILSAQELHGLRNFLLTFEGTVFCYKQAVDDETKAENAYVELFKTAQLYVSHFIQVLNLAIIRNEVKVECLAYYGLEGSNQFVLPDLSTEESILEWGERLVKGEMERVSRGGIAIYNPAIAKVRVHYELFKESLHRLKICRQNTIRIQEGFSEMQDKADRIIWNTWTKVEFKYWGLAPDERKKKFNDYQIQFHYVIGEQLDVFS